MTRADGVTTIEQPFQLGPSGTISLAQSENIWGFGYSSIIDSNAPNGASGLNAPAKACVSLMQTDGYNVSNPNSEITVIQNCDAVSLFTTALEAGKSISPQGFLRGVNGLGSTLTLGLANSTLYNSANHSGIGAVAPFRLNNACKCFRYTSHPGSL